MNVKKKKHHAIVLKKYLMITPYNHRPTGDGPHKPIHGEM